MARERSLALVIKGQVEGAKRALNDTSKAAKSVGDEAEKASKRATTAGERMVHSARDNAQAWSTVGTTVAGAGAAMLAGFGAAQQVQGRLVEPVDILEGAGLLYHKHLAAQLQQGVQLGEGEVGK